MVACITTLLQYGPHADDVTGSLIQFNAEAFWLELGLTGQLFEASVALALGIMDSWIKASWLDLANHNIHLMADIPDFQVPREGNKEIMCILLQAGFCMEELASLNQCWIYN